VSAAARTTLFAHRGASADFHEHTRAAYLEAIRQGADGLETDVRLTADGHLVCWHDPTTDRVAGVPGWVHELTLDELRALDVTRGQAIPAEYGTAAEQVMTLPELLALIAEADRPVRLALEIKQPGPAGFALDAAVLLTLQTAGWDASTGRLGESSVDLMCFWPQTVASLLENVSPSLVMLLVEDAEHDELVRWVEHETGGVLSGDSAERAVADAETVRDELLDDVRVGVGPDREIVKRDPQLVRSWTESGRSLRVWTVDDIADALLCLDVGVTELTTNRPKRLRGDLERY
jgi:glycerophosphoryl diester phosphodiesterase